MPPIYSPNAPPPTLETMPGIRQQAFLLKRFAKPRFDFIWHLHPEFELTHIERGSGVRHVGNSIHPFYEGDLCLFGANLPHAYGCHPAQAATCRWTVVHFLPEIWGDAFWQLAENKRLSKLFRSSRQGLCFRGNGVTVVRRKLASLQMMPQGQGARLLLFLEILQMLADLPGDRLDTGNHSAASAGNIDPRISKVLSWLEENFSDDISQGDAAGLVGLSTAALSRLFHAKTGRLFSRHLNEIRIAHARVALITTEHTIAEIAFASGFNNLSNFNRRFTEIVGVTPRECRKYPPLSLEAKSS